MVATTTQSTILPINKLAAAYPEFHFEAGGDFHWDPVGKTVFYDANSSDSTSLLHELAHAILQHDTFRKDIELIEIERDAWAYAKEQLAPTYGSTITNEAVDQALDTYRDWLHARSTCPGCSATGVQIKTNIYKCIACDTRWRVNDARVCGLRRYTINKNTF